MWKYLLRNNYLYTYSALIMKLSLLFSLLIASYCSVSAQTRQDSVHKRVYKTPSISISSTLANVQSPATYSELNKGQIQEKNSALDIGYVLSELPSLYSVSQNGNNIGYTSISLRGFDQRRISVMINGVPQNDPEDHNVYMINVPDIASSSESIQVQRGAGLMNYGSAAMAGSINIQTIAGASQYKVTASQFIGFQQLFSNKQNQDTWYPSITKSSLHIQSGLIGSQYAFNARLSSIQSLGSRQHSNSSLQSYFLSATRFDEKSTSQINMYGGPISDALAYTGIPKSWIKSPSLQRENLNGWSYDSSGTTIGWFTNRRRQEIENFSQPHFEILSDIYISEHLSLKSTLFHYSGEGFFDYDASWADAATLRITPEYGFQDSINPANALIRGFVGNSQYGWIPRLVWEHGNGVLTLGAEYRSHNSIHWGKIRYAEQLPSGFDPDYTIYEYEGHRRILSAFAREEWNISDKFLFKAEAQLVHHLYGISKEKAGNSYTSYVDINGNTIGNGNQLFSKGFLFINPRIGSVFRVNEENTFSFSMAYTSREPRMRNLYAAEDSYFGARPLFQSSILANGQIGFDFSNPLVKPEHMLNTELGWKYTSNNMNAGITAYIMNYYNELVKSGRLDIFGVPVDGNAPRTNHMGIELELSKSFMISKSYTLELAGNLTYSKNTIIDYTYYTAKGEAVSLSNNNIAGFPDIMGFGRISFRSNSTFISIHSKIMGGFYTDNFGNLLRTDARIKEDLSNSLTGYYTDNTVDAYTIFGIDCQYEYKNVSIGIAALRLKLQAINIFDTLYASGGEGKEFFPGQRRTIIFGAEIDF